MAKIISPIMIDRFVEMYIMGMKMTNIAKDLGTDRSTIYKWLERPEVKMEIEARQQEIRDAGIRFIKARYEKYLANIDRLCNQKEDKRSALAANQFMVEKMDGKNTARLEIKEDKQEESVDILAELEENEAELRVN